MLLSSLYAYFMLYCMCVFSFPPASASYILLQFAQYGNILRHTVRHTLLKSPSQLVLFSNTVHKYDIYCMYCISVKHVSYENETLRLSDINEIVF